MPGHVNHMTLTILILSRSNGDPVVTVAVAVVAVVVVDAVGTDVSVDDPAVDEDDVGVVVAVVAAVDGAAEAAAGFRIRDIMKEEDS
jgi:hypothetical protein